MFVDNTVTSGHQAKIVALNYSLEAKKQRSKAINLKVRGMNRLGNNSIYDKV
jgi:hypothetical protein